MKKFLVMIPLMLTLTNCAPVSFTSDSKLAPDNSQLTPSVDIDPTAIGTVLTPSGAIGVVATLNPGPTPAPTPAPYGGFAPQNVSSTGTTTLDVSKVLDMSGFTGEANGIAFNWGYMHVPGSYVELLINVPTAGTYNLKVLYAILGSNTVSIKLDSVNQGSLNLYGTGSYSTYTNTVALPVTLPAGLHALRVTATTSESINIGGISLTK